MSLIELILPPQLRGMQLSERSALTAKRTSLLGEEGCPSFQGHPSEQLQKFLSTSAFLLL